MTGPTSAPAQELTARVTTAATVVRTTGVMEGVVTAVETMATQATMTTTA
jgi:hypothetical protein